MEKYTVLVAPNVGSVTPLRCEKDIPFYTKYPIQIKRDTLVRLWDYAISNLHLRDRYPKCQINPMESNKLIYSIWNWKIIDVLFFTSSTTPHQDSPISASYKYYVIQSHNIIGIVKEENIIQ